MLFHQMVTGFGIDYFREDAVRNKIVGNYIGTNAEGSRSSW